jgi:hypothetical protein
MIAEIMVSDYEDCAVSDITASDFDYDGWFLKERRAQVPHAGVLDVFLLDFSSLALCNSTENRRCWSMEMRMYLLGAGMLILYYI